MLEGPVTTHMQCSYWGKEVVGQNLAIHGPIHPSSSQYGAVVLSPLQKSTPKTWCFLPHVSRLGWCSWDCTHPSSSKCGEWSLYQKALFWSHLTTWPSPMPPLDHPDGLWQTSDGPGHVLARAGGPFACCRILIHNGLVCYIFSKCFEKLIKTHICSILPALIDTLQFAYRSNRSTDDAIAFTLHTLLSLIWTVRTPMWECHFWTTASHSTPYCLLDLL